MGTNGPGNPVIYVVVALVAASVALALLGLALRRRGVIASSGAALAWAVLCILPLFGAGFWMMTRHQVEQATGQTRSGVDAAPARGAP